MLTEHGMFIDIHHFKVTLIIHKDQSVSKTRKNRNRSSNLIFIHFLCKQSLQELLPLDVGGLVIKHASLDYFRVHIELVASSSLDALLHRVDCHQAQHPHLILLANTMSSVLSL